MLDQLRDQAFHEAQELRPKALEGLRESVEGVAKRTAAFQALEVNGLAAAHSLVSGDNQPEDAPVAQALEVGGQIDQAAASFSEAITGAAGAALQGAMSGAAGADVASMAVTAAASSALTSLRQNAGLDTARQALADVQAATDEAKAEEPGGDAAQAEAEAKAADEAGSEQGEDEEKAEEGEGEGEEGEGEEEAEGEGEEDAEGEGDEDAEGEGEEGEDGEGAPGEAEAGPGGPLQQLAGLVSGGLAQMIPGAPGGPALPGGVPGLSAVIDLAGATQEAMAAVSQAVAEPARMLNQLELPRPPKMAPEQAEQWQAEHGMTPEVHHTRVSGQLQGLVSHARTQFDTLGQQGQALRQSLTTTGQQTGVQVDQVGQQAGAAVQSAYGQARTQVTQGAQQAQTQIGGAARQARTGMQAAHQQSIATANQTRTQVLAAIERKKTAAATKIQTAIEEKAKAIEKVGVDQGKAAQDKCTELATEFEGGGGDARERLTGKIKGKTARNAAPGYVQRFKATADRHAAAARQQAAAAERLLGAFVDSLVQRLDAGHEQGLARTAQRVQETGQQLEQTQQQATQSTAQAGQRAQQMMQQGQTRDRQALQSQARQARTTMDQQLAQAQTGTAQAVEGARQRHAQEMDGVQRGIDGLQGRPDPQAVQRSMTQARGRLETTHAGQVQRLRAQHQQTEQGIRQQAQQRGQQVQQAAQQRGQAARQQGASQLQTVQQGGAQAQQRLAGMGGAVSSQLQQQAPPVTLANAEQQADEGFANLEAGIVGGLERQRAALEQQLTQQVTGIAQTVGQAGDRAAQQKMRQLSQKATTIRNAADGWGTDESAMLGALAGMNQLESQVVQAIYQDHYGRSLRSEIEDELSDEELDEALAHLSGNRVNGALARLDNSISWTGDDEAAIEQTLRSLTPEELAELRQRMRDDPRAAAIIERVRDNLGGHDLDVTDALLEGNQAQADAIRLHEAMDGMGTDEDAVYRILENAPPERRAQIQSEYARYASAESGEPTTLEADIRDDFGDAEQDLGLALMNGDRVGATAARLEIAADGMGTDEAEIFRRLDDPRMRSNDPRVREQAMADRQALRERYQAEYGRSLDSMIESEMGDASDEDNYEAQMATQYLDNGRADPDLMIRYATDGIGTDEAMVQNALRGMSASEIEALRGRYRSQYGENLDDVLAGELSGSEGHEVEILMLGRPETPEQFMEIARRRHEFQRGSGTMGMDFFESIGATESGAMLDANYERMQAFYDTVDWENATPEEQQRLRELAGFVDDDAASYQAAKDSITDGVVTAIELTGAIVATVVTAGAASPALAAVICAGVTGATVMAAKATIQGNSYGAEQFATDLGQTAINMATAGLGSAASVRNAAGRYGAMVASRLPGSAQWVDNVIAMGLEGAAGGALDSVGRAVLNDRAWDQGIEAWASQVAFAGAQGGVSGFVGGAAGADMEGYFGAAQTGMRSAVREGFANMAGDAAGLLIDPNTYSQDIDQVLRGYFANVPQSFATGAIGGYGAGYMTNRRGTPRHVEDGRSAVPSRQTPPGGDAGGMRPGSDGHDSSNTRRDADASTTVRDADTTVRDADATVITGDADTTVRDADTTVRDADATVITGDADVTVRDADTTVRDADTTVRDADATVITGDADVTVRDADTTVRDADATVITGDADSTVVVPRQPATPAEQMQQHADRLRDSGRVERVEGLQRVGEPDAGTSDAFIMQDPATGERFLFKPTTGEGRVPRAEAAGIERGTYAERAVAGGEMADALGVGTPSVRLVEIDGQVGSLQDWVPNATSLGDLRFTNEQAYNQIVADPEYLRQRAGIDTLDYLMNNLDRNAGNLLVITDAQGNFERLIPIDHDLTFGPGQERTVLEGWARGLPDSYDPAIRQRLTEMAADPQALRQRLESVLPANEVDGVMHRLNDLLGDMRNSAGIRVDDLPGDVMGPHQSSRIEGALAAMSHADHARMTQLLQNSQSPRERALLLKAATAGHSVDSIQWFAGQIRGKNDGWLQLMTSLSDAQQGDRGLRQQYHDTCGVTTAQALQGEYDPIYALRLRLENTNIHLVDDSDPTAINPNLAREQAELTERPYQGELGGNLQGHQGVPVPRDQSGGRGRFLDDLFSSIQAQTGQRYSPRLDPDPATITSSLATALDNGQVMPVVVGSGPRSYGHYVLVTDTRITNGKREYLFHEPWDGVTVWRSEADILSGRLDLAGWNRITGIEVPTDVGPTAGPRQGDAGIAAPRTDASTTTHDDAATTRRDPRTPRQDARTTRRDPNAGPSPVAPAPDNRGPIRRLWDRLTAQFKAWFMRNNAPRGSTNEAAGAETAIPTLRPGSVGDNWQEPFRLRYPNANAGDLTQYLTRLQSEGANSARNMDVSDAQSVVAVLAADPRVDGLDAWLDGAGRAYGPVDGPQQRLDFYNELREARQRLSDLDDSATIDISESAIPGPSNKTADIQYSDGRQVEIKTVREPIIKSTQLMNQTSNAARKFDGVPDNSGPFEIVLYASYQANFLTGTQRGSVSMRLHADGYNRVTDVASGRELNKTDFFNPYLTELNASPVAGLENVERIVVRLENGDDITLVNGDSGWARAGASE